MDLNGANAMEFFYFVQIFFKIIDLISNNMYNNQIKDAFSFILSEKMKIS